MPPDSQGGGNMGPGMTGAAHPRSFLFHCFLCSSQSFPNFPTPSHFIFITEEPQMSFKNLFPKKNFFFPLLQRSSAMLTRIHSQEFFFNITYLFIHRDAEREREAEGEAGSMQRAQRGTRSRDSRIMPWAAGGTKPLSHPSCPNHFFSAQTVCFVG